MASEVYTETFNTYLNISSSSSKCSAPNKCPATLINPLPKPLAGAVSNVLSLLDTEYSIGPISHCHKQHSIDKRHCKTPNSII